MKQSVMIVALIAATALACPTRAEEGETSPESGGSPAEPEANQTETEASKTEEEGAQDNQGTKAEESSAETQQAIEQEDKQVQEAPADDKTIDGPKNAEATVTSTPQEDSAKEKTEIVVIENADDGMAENSEENLEEQRVTPPLRTHIGLSPGAPEVPAFPGGVTPVFGTESLKTREWQFAFHGMAMIPLRFGINKREDPGPGQKETVLHAPPRVPGDFESFGYTSVVPQPWTQLNFNYGNQTVMATVIVAARTVTNANGYFDPPDMLGINDAYLTFGKQTEQIKLQMNIGAFANRYGNMGEYDLGRYGTPLIARVAGTGLTGTGMVAFGPHTLMGEAGFQGQFNKAPVGVEPAGWNGFADPNVGSSYAGHGHLGFNIAGFFELGSHLVAAFNRDDRATPGDNPDGRILVVGADTRLTAGRGGHLYMGYGFTDANTARTVSNVIRILNAPGGPGLMREYLGPRSEGTGNLHTFGLQYDFSLGNALRYPDHFEGDGPDLILSPFMMLTHVKSPNDAAFDGVTKMKIGGEIGYSIIKWLALGARYDHVVPNIDDSKLSHAIVSGRIIFHSDWNSQDQVVLQYSYFRNGTNVPVREGYPPEDNTLGPDPDAHVLSLTASMWW